MYGLSYTDLCYFVHVEELCVLVLRNTGCAVELYKLACLIKEIEAWRICVWCRRQFDDLFPSCFMIKDITFC